MKPLAIVALLLACSQAAAAAELLTIEGAAAVSQTLDRLEGAARANGFVIVARVDHAAAAATAGLPLRPTAMPMFGRPQGGTPVMQCGQRTGLDLPLRAVAWQDDAGQVWPGMADPAALAARYGLPVTCDAPVAAMQGAVRRPLDQAAKG